MGGRDSEDREDQQRLSGETVRLEDDKADEDGKKVSVLSDEEWDFYSGLPNPKWYEKQKENE